MKDNISAYAIFNITQNKYIVKPSISGGRKYLIYGDLASARRMLTQLKKYEFKNDKLRIVELVPKIEDLGWDNE